MTRKMLALGSAALAALMLTAGMSTADARGGHHGGHHGYSGRHGYTGPRSFGPRHSGPRFYGRGHHRHHGRGFIIGAPFVYGGYSYYGYGGCEWLRRRAIATGSPYYWDRYYACIGD
jgi:hypothetical protein